MKLRSKLFIILALASVLPLLLVLGLVVSQSAKRLEAQARHEIRAALDQSIQDARAELAADQSMVRALATVPTFGDFVRVMGGRNPAAYRQQAQRITNFMLKYQLSQPGIQAIRILDTSGVTLLKVKEGKVVTPEYTLPDGRPYIANVGIQPFFRWARDNLQPGQLAMSRFEMGQEGPSEDFCPPMIRYMIPLSVRGEVRAYLAVNTWGKRFDDFFSRVVSSSEGKVFVAEINAVDRSRDGVFLYHPDLRMRFADQTGAPYRFTTEFSPELWRQVQAHREGTMRLPGGKDLLFFRHFSPGGMDNPSWVVATRVSRDALLAPVEEMRRSILGMAALLLVASLVLSRWLAKQLAEPIQFLAAKLKGYADGERNFPLPARRGDELGLLTQAFNYMVQRLEATAMDRDRAEIMACQAAKLATVGELAAGLGHEINNPLNNILGLAKLMEREGGDELPDWIKNDLTTMRRECERAAEIVQGLLNFARRMEPQYGRFSLNALLDEACSLLRRKAQAAGVRLVARLEGDCLLHADRNQILQVLINVLLNAIQASPAQGEVRIHAELGGDDLWLRIEDAGPGVADEHLVRIFDPFFSTKAEGQGTGLGLSISFGIVRRHNGDIQVDRSADLGGARVTIRLPIRAPADIPEQSTAIPSIEEALRHVG
ncbi:sensor histidine kinase [Thermithiobacillus tepidarius DSM 3134]|uniref:sensor histidine kinase n=1 Tax=Thermithiobacillus tepidarius TaxID=929 RepID=UPI0004064C26|nr:sensor histidine kinase [Thermithiobacillus tepidarius]